MKITKLETFCNEFVGFVRATAETGAQGWVDKPPSTWQLAHEIGRAHV